MYALPAFYDLLNRSAIDRIDIFPWNYYPVHSKWYGEFDIKLFGEVSHNYNYC